MAHQNEPTHARKSMKARRCNLRKRMTPAETVLWERLRDRRCAGRKFRRQHSIDTYIVDFYCAAERLIIEVDGGIHAHPDQRIYDRERTADLKAAGFKVLRFANEEVLENLEGVLSRIEEHFRF